MSNDLINVFNELKELLQELTGLFVKTDDEQQYELWSKKEIVIDGRKKKEVYFAGLIIQSNYVGLYFMPIYTDPEISQFINPDLIKLLKGKSCFHIKQLTEKVKRDIKQALEIGYRLYIEKGWL